MRDGKWYVVIFPDGHGTQASTKMAALDMCVELRSGIDDRNAGNYFAKWVSPDSIAVIALEED